MITRSEVMTLINAEPDPAVSIYLPVYQIPPEDKKNDIRIRNLIRDAEKSLERNGYEPSKILARATQDKQFRLPIGDPNVRGAAIFLSAAFARSYPLPIATPEYVGVRKAFHILPLMPLIEDAQSFFIIAIDQKNARLFKANQYGMSVFDSKVMDESLAAMREKTELSANVGFHSASSTSGGRPDAKHHAQGESAADYQQVQLDQFTRGIAKTVDQILAKETASLIAVCEPNLLGMFRKHCRYPGLSPDSLTKSPVGLDDGEIHETCVELVDTALNKPKTETVTRFTAGLQRGDATVTVKQKEIVKSAMEGRIEYLLLNEDWRRSDVEEVDKIAHETLRHGGDVAVIAVDEMPDKTTIGAILRY